MAVTDEIASRYGRTPSRARRDRWLLGALGAVIVVVVAVWVVWAGLDGSTPTVEAQDIGHTVVDEHTVSVEFEVSVPTGTATSCAVQALDENFTVVGWKVIDLPPSDVHTRRFTEVLRTMQPSNTGLIYRCWLT
ncbi:DUF4307 domain-containing protein [Compostimonas suwonensis]|uniref:Uncharacterized protein DUF4307 n=1 Tax=Compostimonas suwonensis TaxID=1048394 RepID=A0A2M9BW95_9MICO|nr:DUF4307 domain-containing protein [Compostimonas suwonensis]PJJ62210.1 uncharacterized protein DUF4307 [Compostimonas suwonensis]